MSTATIESDLTPVETAKLENLEIIIESGLKSFLATGNALLQIRDQRLYRATHSTFDAYCRVRWGFERTYANRLANAAATVDLLPIGNTLPTNEAQVRPLTKLPADQRADAWKEAVEESGGKPTAAVVADVVARRTHSSNEIEGRWPGAMAALGITEEMVSKAQVVLGIGTPELIKAVETGQLELDNALAQIPCPNCGSTEWTSDEMGCYCDKCREGDIADSGPIATMKVMQPATGIIHERPANAPSIINCFPNKHDWQGDFCPKCHTTRREVPFAEYQQHQAAREKARADARASRTTLKDELRAAIVSVLKSRNNWAFDCEQSSRDLTAIAKEIRDRKIQW